jgi:hypothetical protein
MLLPEFRQTARVKHFSSNHRGPLLMSFRHTWSRH